MFYHSYLIAINVQEMDATHPEDPIMYKWFCNVLEKLVNFFLFKLFDKSSALYA